MAANPVIRAPELQLETEKKTSEATVRATIYDAAEGRRRSRA